MKIKFTWTALPGEFFAVWSDHDQAWLAGKTQRDGKILVAFMRPWEFDGTTYSGTTTLDKHTFRAMFNQWVHLPHPGLPGKEAK